MNPWNVNFGLNTDGKREHLWFFKIYIHRNLKAGFAMKHIRVAFYLAVCKWAPWHSVTDLNWHPSVNIGNWFITLWKGIR